MAAKIAESAYLPALDGLADGRPDGSPRQASSRGWSARSA